jgi:hypothetical protein
LPLHTYNKRLSATVLLSNTLFFQYLSNFDPPIVDPKIGGMNTE